MTTQILLYAEDEQNDIFFLRRALRLSGTEVQLHTVGTGPATIEYLSGSGEFADRTVHPLPTLVLLDVNLPGCSGFDVLKWLREQPAIKDLPVIMFSSSARPEDIQRAKELGATHYWQKPASGIAFSQIAEKLQEYWMNQTFSASTLAPDLATSPKDRTGR